MSDQSAWSKYLSTELQSRPPTTSIGCCTFYNSQVTLVLCCENFAKGRWQLYWPHCSHCVCGMQWSQLQLSIVIIYYREQSGSVSPVSCAPTHPPDGGSVPSWLSPPGRGRCHLVRETDDRNGFISANRRLCNLITLMWFILAFRHADHRPAPARTRHFYCSPDTAINTRQVNQTII